MRRVYLVLLVVLLAVIGCGKKSAPDKEAVAQAVEATLTAIAASPVVVIVTATPEPATATPEILTSTPVPPTETLAPTVTELTVVGSVTTPMVTATELPTATTTEATPVAVVKAEGSINVRSGPGTAFAAIGKLAPKNAVPITGRNEDGTWFEVKLADGKNGWVAAFLVDVSGPALAITVAQNIPTPPPAPTMAPTALEPTAAASVTPVSKPGLHVRQTIGNWEIQPERVYKEKAVYWYGDPTIAMGVYAIVIVQAKNTASGTDYMSRTVAPFLRDNKGKFYEYSDPLTTERKATLAAAWEFDVHPTVFTDIQPGTEPPLLLLWDVDTDVQSLTLIMTDGVNRVEWDLGDFVNIPPFKK